MATNIDRMPDLGTSNDQRRMLAIRRIKEKNDFKVHVLAYLVVNTMLIIVWAFTGSGFFWPIFVIGFWGIGVVLNGYTVYRGNDITEAQIEHEMQRMPRV